ncbi:MAG: DUF4105 domain-containing protein, partial [Bdellovibrionales bacterium]|nr:DUF4105 domain-containing protein [Bdellovibrionales bacterium]
YVSIEGRDLWEFPLQLSEKQKIKLLHHIIELEAQDFPYYYFDYNCSYFILSLLQVLYPEKMLMDDFWFSTIPYDTLKTLQKNKIIEKFEFRPSNLRVIETKWNALNKFEKKQVLSDKKAESVRALEVKMDLAYLRSNQGEDVKTELYDLQLQRAKLGSQKTFETNLKPEASILSEWPTSFLGFSASKDTAGMHVLPALKDSLTPTNYMKGINISLLETKLIYEDSYLYLSDLSLMDIRSYPLYTELFKKMSYEISLFYRDSKHRAANSQLKVAFGYSFSLYDDLVWQFFLNTRAKHQDDSTRFGAGYIQQLSFQHKKWTALIRQEITYFDSIDDDKDYHLSIGREISYQKQLRFNYLKTETYPSLSEIEFVFYF